MEIAVAKLRPERFVIGESGLIIEIKYVGNGFTYYKSVGRICRRVAHDYPEIRRHICDGETGKHVRSRACSRVSVACGVICRNEFQRNRDYAFACVAARRKRHAENGIRTYHGKTGADFYLALGVYPVIQIYGAIQVKHSRGA